MPDLTQEGDYVPPQPMGPGAPSQAFIRAQTQVGSGPQARAAATAGAFPPEVLSPWTGPADAPIWTPPPPPQPTLGSVAPAPGSFGQPGGFMGAAGVMPVTGGVVPAASNIRDPENPYLPPTPGLPVVAAPPSPEYQAAWYARQPSSGSNAGIGVRGRPTAERLGVDPGMGGLARPEDATFASSNVLIAKVLADLPPIFQQFANRPISRFTSTDIYGTPTNAGGYYQGVPDGPRGRGPGDAVSPTPKPAGATNTTIAVGRGVETQETPLNAVNAARHELFHALAAEAEPFREDSRDGYRLLQYATVNDWPSLQGPQFRGISSKIATLASRGDWGHVFTEIADMSARGQPLPPSLARYFSPMHAAAPSGAAPMTAPPSAPPPRG